MVIVVIDVEFIYSNFFESDCEAFSTHRTNYTIGKNGLDRLKIQDYRK